MTLDAMDWVWQHSTSKGTARLALLAIADKAGRDCTAWAGTTFLVQRTNAARSAVVKAVDGLIKSGELKIIADRVGPRGERVYRLPLAVGHRRTGGPESGPVQNQDRSGIRTPGGPESGPVGVRNQDPTGPESGPQNTYTHEHHGEHISSSAAAEETEMPPAAEDPKPEPQLPAGEQFGAFWLVYPKKRAKETARKAWAAAIKRGADPAAIVAAATAYAHERAQQDPKFTKHPATWLNAGCYDDEPEQPAPRLRVVGSNYQPFQCPPPEAYANDLGF